MLQAPPFNLKSARLMMAAAVLPTVVLKLTPDTMRTKDGEESIAKLAVSLADAVIQHIESNPLPGEPTMPEVSAATLMSSGPTLQDLGVSGRATAPLKRVGVIRLGDLTQKDRKMISELHGVSQGTMDLLDRLMASHGLLWPGQTPPGSEIVVQADLHPEEPTDAGFGAARDDDEEEDVL